jgi:hypothetical protein
VLDTVWLPQVAHQGWLILTRDFNIRRTPAELQAVRTNAARMVALSGDLAGTKWGQLQLLMMRWDRIEELASEPGPFIVLASRAGLRSVDLAA